MEQLELIQKQLDVQAKDHEVMSKGIGMEFDKIAKAFSQMGNLLDLLYLETSVLIELLVKKNVFTQEEFTGLLEETAKKVEAEIKKSSEDAAAAAKAQESSIITKV